MRNRRRIAIKVISVIIVLAFLIYTYGSYLMEKNYTHLVPTGTLLQLPENNHTQGKVFTDNFSLLGTEAEYSFSFVWSDRLWSFAGSINSTAHITALAGIAKVQQTGPEMMDLELKFGKIALTVNNTTAKLDYNPGGGYIAHGHTQNNAGMQPPYEYYNWSADIIDYSAFKYNYTTLAEWDSEASILYQYYLQYSVEVTPTVEFGPYLSVGNTTWVTFAFNLGLWVPPAGAYS